MVKAAGTASASNLFALLEKSGLIADRDGRIADAAAANAPAATEGP